MAIALQRPLNLARRCACRRVVEDGRLNAAAAGRRDNQHAAYIVLIPEVPPDSPDTNALMRLEPLPAFSEITPVDCVNGVAKLAIEFETELALHAEKLPTLARTFEAVIDPLEMKAMPLNYAWKTVKHLNHVKRDDKFPKAFRRVHPHVLTAKNERWSNKPLQKVVKELRSKDDIDDYQRRVLDIYELNGRLNGIHLEEADFSKFKHFAHTLNEEKTQFRRMVDEQESLFSSTLTDPEDVISMPHAVIKSLADDKLDPIRGPWTVSIKPEIYHPFMEHCPNRAARWNAWQAFYNKAGPMINVWKTNKKRIEDIRFARIEQARLLGFKNFAEMSQETKMAGSVDVVLGFLENMRSFGRPVVDEEMKELEAFSKENRLVSRSLELHDLPFCRRLHRKALFPSGADDAKVSEYFEFDHVFHELINIVGTLFGIEFSRSPEGIADVYHSDVRLYQVKDLTTGLISHLYVDPFGREDKINGTWFEAGRERCSLTGSTPVGYLNCNFTPSPPGTAVLLTFGQLNDLFFEMGSALRTLLSSTPYSEISGAKNVEWDAVDVPGFVMTHLLTDYDVVRRLSRHVVTGDSMSKDLFDEVLGSHRHMASYDLLWQCFLAAFDIEVFIGYRTFWIDLMKQLFKLYLPFKYDKDNFYQPCSFNQIFADEYPAAYYSQKWAEMVAADVWARFEESGFSLDNPDSVACGHLFKSTFLSIGGGQHSTEVFRKFRGNDPSTDAMLKKYGLMS